ncbi:MAG: glycosyl hydrolase [Bacteroidales bacterium]
MKRLKRLSTLLSGCFLMASLVISCSPEKAPSPGKHIRDFDGLRKEFSLPSAEFGTVPFFVWNGKITRPDIDSYLIDFKEAGCGGVFIHARPGLVTTYLTEEWFDLFRYTVKKGKELGINVWIYDEYNFPSGFAGGHVPAEMPESYNQGQGLQMKKADTAPPDTAGYYLALKESGGRFEEVSDRKAEAGKAGNYYLFTKAWYSKGENDYYFHGNWYGGYTYVDLLVPGVTEKFIRANMDGYEKYAGDEFGKSMPGIFTDEPHLNSPGGIRWTPDLFVVFEKQWGYDLKLNLPSLFEEVGDWKKVRHNYAQTLLQLFIDRWAKPYSQYAAKKGLLWTGHYWEHEWPFIRLGPDNMAMYPWFQVPGIDCLFNQFNETSTSAQFGNVRSVKELASVANQYGLNRTLCETYGGGGWDVTFADLKRLGDWEYALGVNMMNQHMSPITIEGYRKYDHPPYFTYHEPWWKHYGHLNRYFGRLSAALSSGKQVNDILVIEPTTSAWMYDSYGKPDPRTQETGNSFQSFITKLEKAQVEYDLGSENILRENGRAENGRLVVGQRSYSKVIIPPFAENINRATLELLKAYVSQGGRLYLYSRPERIEGSADPAFAGLLKANRGNIVQPGDSLATADTRLFAGEELKIEHAGGNLFHHRRILTDGQVLFLVNSSMADSVTGKASLAGRQAIVMDAFTGKMAKYPASPDGKGSLSLDFALPPAGSLLLFIAASENKDIPDRAKPVELIPVPLSSAIEVKRMQDNALNIDFCELALEGQPGVEMNVLDASDKVYKHYGFERGDPWATFVQFDNKLMARDTFGQGTGFKATYQFTVEGGFDISGIRAVVERPDLWKVSVNGTDVKKIPGEWWLDRNFGVFAIGSLVKSGENVITLEVYPMKLFAEIEPVYITGIFSVVPADKGWKLTEPPGNFTTGSWSGQGLPFYSWGVSYTRSFEVQKPGLHYEIGLGEWKGTIAEVTVNGSPAGTIAYPPYRLDVSGLIREGNNSVTVTILGSLKNLLGPHHKNPPAGMAISPFWRGVKSYPPGKDYQILDYGLMEDLWLYRSR